MTERKTYKLGEPGCPPSPGVSYAGGAKFKAAPGAMYRLEGKRCGDCAHFPLCSRHGDKSARTWQDYCSRPSRGFLPLHLTVESTARLRVGDSLQHRVLDQDVIGLRGKAIRADRDTFLHHGLSTPSARRELRALEAWSGEALTPRAFALLLTVCENLGLPALYADAPYLPSSSPKHPMNKWRVALEVFTPPKQGENHGR